MAIILYNGESQVVTLPRLRSGLDEAQFKNTGTVTGTLIAPDGSEVSGMQNMPLLYVTNSNGNYQLSIPSTLNLDPGNYILKITAVADGNTMLKNVKVKISNVSPA